MRLSSWRWWLPAFCWLAFSAFLAAAASTGDLEGSEPAAPELAKQLDGKEATSTKVKVTATSSQDPEARPRSAKELLRQQLLHNYDVNAPPTLDHNQPMEVQVGMALIHLDVDESRSTVTVDSWLRLRWKDQHLQWNKAAQGGVDSLHFAYDEIWKPDIMLYNSAGKENVDSVAFTHMLVSSNGDVLWVPPAKLEAFCMLDLLYWPMDEQKCRLKFGSWTSHGNQINLVIMDNVTEVEKLNFYTSNREWNIGKTFAERNEMKYSCCPESYPDITFTFELKRDSHAYRSLIIFPCLVLMLITSCAFLLPPDSGEKLYINGVALIGTLIYLVYFASTLPFHQRNTPLLVSFYSNTAGLVGIAIVLNVFCIGMVRERRYTGPPKFLKKAFAGALGKCLCLSSYTHQVSSTHQRLMVELSDFGEVGGENHVGSRRRNSVSTTITNISQRDTIDEYEEVDSSYGGGASQEGPPASGNNSNRNQHRQSTSSPFAAHPSQFLSRDEMSSDCRRDWMLIAAGLERLFFVTYAIAFSLVASMYA